MFLLTVPRAGVRRTTEGIQSFYTRRPAHYSRKVSQVHEDFIFSALRMFLCGFVSVISPRSLGLGGGLDCTTNTGTDPLIYRITVLMKCQGLFYDKT